MLRRFIILAACVLLGGQAQAQSNSAPASTAAAPNTVTIHASPDAPAETVMLHEVTGKNLIDPVRRQIAAADYSCPAISHLWILAYTRQAGMIVYKVQCSNGADYQFTLMDKEVFTKPWSGVLLGP